MSSPSHFSVYSAPTMPPDRVPAASPTSSRRGRGHTYASSGDPSRHDDYRHITSRRSCSHSHPPPPNSPRDYVRVTTRITTSPTLAYDQFASPLDIQAMNDFSPTLAPDESVLALSCVCFQLAHTATLNMPLRPPAHLLRYGLPYLPRPAPPVAALPRSSVDPASWIPTPVTYTLQTTALSQLTLSQRFPEPLPMPSLIPPCSSSDA